MAPAPSQTRTQNVPTAPTAHWRTCPPWLWGTRRRHPARSSVPAADAPRASWPPRPSGSSSRSPKPSASMTAGDDGIGWYNPYILARASAPGPTASGTRPRGGRQGRLSAPVRRLQDRGARAHAKARAPAPELPWRLQPRLRLPCGRRTVLSPTSDPGTPGNKDAYADVQTSPESCCRTEWGVIRPYSAHGTGLLDGSRGSALVCAMAKQDVYHEGRVHATKAGSQWRIPRDRFLEEFGAL